MGTQPIRYQFTHLSYRNTPLIFTIYFVDENKYIKGKCFYVRFPLHFKHSKQKHSQIKGLVVKYIKSGFGAILGQLCVRLFDDMPSIVHRMRF